MKKELDKEFLGKIIALAKQGVGGEKANAIRIVKKAMRRARARIRRRNERQRDKRVLPRH